MPRRASSSFRRTAAASSVDSGIRPPLHRGTAVGSPFARFTHTVIWYSRMNWSTRPANGNRSPGFSRAANASSTVPSRPPRRNRTSAVASPVMVPTLIRCRRATASSAGTNRPSRTTTRRYSGYARSASPPRVTKSSTQAHSSADRSW